MNCPDLAQIYACLEKELSPEDRLRLEEHLATCSRCRRLLADRRLYLEASSSLPQLELPPGFTERVMAGLPPLKSPARLWLWLAGGAYLLFSLVVAGLALGNKTVLFPICFQVFKNLVNLAADLSSLVFRLVQQAYGVFRAVSIFMGIAGRLLSNFFPASIMGLAALVLSGAISLAFLRLLLRPAKFSDRG